MTREISDLPLVLPGQTALALDEACSPRKGPMKTTAQYQFISDPMIRDVSHAPGVVVARPPRHLSCWAVVATHRGQALPKPYGCRVRHRGNCLTCYSHRAKESAAQELRERLLDEAAELSDVATWAETVKEK